MNKYQEAFEELCITWDEEGMGKDHFKDQYPHLYNTIKELVDKATPKKPIGRHTDYKCPVCGRRVRSGLGSSSRQRDYVCQRCFQVLDW